MKQEKIMCPSSKGKQGALLLGVRQNGAIAILPQALQIDQEFIEKANEPTPAEQHFRFANKCVEAGCKQWANNKCGVIDKMQGFLDQVVVSDKLPECSIRHQCRWFLQSAAEACKICPYVITEISQEEIDVFFLNQK